MASIVLVPNVATHRKLPHLPKESRPQQQQASTVQDSKTPPPTAAHAHQFLGIDHRNGSSVAALDNTPSSLAITNTQDISTVPDMAQLRISASSSASSLSKELGVGSDPKNTLTINTQARRSLVGNEQQHADSSTPSASTSLASTSSVKQDHAHHVDNGLARAYSPPPRPQQQQHQFSPMHLLNSPHGPHTSQSTLPPAGASFSLHESKMMKNALYDAFGCLYHPVQHTHHPNTSSPLVVSASSSRLSTTAASLRSGEVTPLLGISPRASPMLRPQLGASAPITPLELSSDDGAAGAGGYFGHHVSALTTSGAHSRHLQHHHHHTHHPSHHHPHGHHPSRHASSHLSSTYTEDYGSNPSTSTNSPRNLSRRASFEFNSTVDLNPTEHPVLCSLHTLNLTHPHPPQHYHPHLGHDLGHDRVPISEPPTTLSTSSCADSILNGSIPRRSKVTAAVHSVHPLTPGEMLKSNSSVSTALPVRSSPFPMDAGSQVENSSSPYRLN